MATDTTSTRQSKYIAIGLKIVAGIMLFPIIWIGVWFNWFGLANRLSGLPGITEGGGVRSGMSTIAFTLVIVGVVGGTLVAAGVVNLSEKTGSPPEPAVEATPTQQPTSTVSIEQPETPTSKPSAAQIRQQQLQAFEAAFRTNVSNAPNDGGVPILATGYRDSENGTRSLWLVFDEIEAADDDDEAWQDMRWQWRNIAVAYANTVGPLEGAQPDRLIVIGPNERWNDTAYSIPTAEAQSVWDREMSLSTYNNNWLNRIHVPTEQEMQIAREMMAAEGNTPTNSLNRTGE